MKKILIIQHELNVSPGTTLDWASQNGYTVEYWYPAEESPAPDLKHYEAFIICGGTMDTFEEERFPWLRTEKKFIRDLIDSNRKVFGLCLGSQLIAEVMGGRVLIHQPGWEIGFVNVKTLNGENLKVFHWHHCTFELPPGAELIATNDFCKNQAFRIGDNVIATQFHPEATPQWIQECSEKIKPQHHGVVQSKDDMIKSLPLQTSLRDWYFQQLDRLFQS